MTGTPVCCSIAFRASPATLPPERATSIFSRKPSSAFCLEISVVVPLAAAPEREAAQMTRSAWCAPSPARQRHPAEHPLIPERYSPTSGTASDLAALHRVRFWISVSARYQAALPILPGCIRIAFAVHAHFSQAAHITNNLNEQILLYRIPSAITSLTHFLLSVNTRKGIFYTNFMPIQGYFR